nr:hypothetical protein [Tanacetum cinerariifolium]
MEPFETDESAATPPPHPAYHCEIRLLLLHHHHYSYPLLVAGRTDQRLPYHLERGIALGPGYEVGESSSATAARPAGGLRADYGFVATMDREIMRDPERDVGYGITDSW